MLQVLVRALHEATHGRPGPVHVDCPGDVAAIADDHGVRRRHFDFEERTRRRRIGRGSRRFSPPRASRCCSSDLALAVPRTPPPFERCAPAVDIPAMVTYKAKGVVADE